MLFKMNLKDRIINYALYTALIVGCFGGVFIYRDYDGFNSQRARLISLIRPYIERVDNKVGIGEEDLLDFAERAGLPIEERGKMKEFDYILKDGDFTNGQLERALESYKKDEASKSLDGAVERN